LQVVVGAETDGVLHIPLFQHRVDLRPGKGRIGAEDQFVTLPLLALDLRQQQFLPIATFFEESSEVVELTIAMVNSTPVACSVPGIGET
jgi:hypothetical protein